jgi:hypothetical protein
VNIFQRFFQFYKKIKMSKKIKIFLVLILILIIVFFVFKNDKIDLLKKVNNEINEEVIDEDFKETDLLKEKEGVIVVEIKESISIDKPEYFFEIYSYKDIDNFYYSANKIIISEKDNQEKIIQEITFENTQTHDSDFFGFVIEDMNFDGYKDIRIQSFVPAGPNTPYYYWLWDNNISQYVRNEDLEKITSPEFDNEKKLVVSHIRISAMEYWTHKYKYENNELILISEEKIIY